MKSFTQRANAIRRAYEALIAGKDREVTTEHEAVLHTGQRNYVEIDAETKQQLQALEGDVIAVSLLLTTVKGQGDRLELVGILGATKKTKNSGPMTRIWLPEHVDIDRVEAVVLRRKRAA